MSEPSILGFLRFLSGGVCHQIPARSLQSAGIVLPLCARCTGTYLGALLGLLTILLRRRTRAGLLPGWPVWIAFAVAFLAWGSDGLNSYLTLIPGAPHLYEPHNILRLLTGTLEGLALSLAIWPLVALTFWKKSRHERVITLPELALSAAAALLIVAILARPLPAVLYAGALASVLGLLGMFTILNALILAIVLHREGTFERAPQLLPLLAGALLLSTVELSGLGLLRRLVLGF